MKAERRSERLTLSVSPAFKKYLKERYEKDEVPHAGFVYPASSVAEYATRILVESTDYWEKRQGEILAALRVDAPPGGWRGPVITPEDVNFCRRAGIVPDLL